VSRLEKGISKTMFDGIFAAGGITLSQVSVMTGLEPILYRIGLKEDLCPRRKKGSIQKISLPV
ncbi:MAG: hypothetical protein IKK26_02730, partial [Clostridia bacterium]|nr:hypothetical protein [Clostridia bacterium]